MRSTVGRTRSIDRLIFGLLAVGIVANFWAARAAQGHTYTQPPPAPLPLDFQGWKGSLMAEDPSVREILPHARVTTARYEKSGQPPCDFALIASRNPADMHTPDRCIQGSGFEIVSDEAREVRVPGPDGGTWPMHRLLIRLRDDAEIVLYGYDGIRTLGGSTLFARIALKLGGARKDPAYFMRFSTPVAGDTKVAETRLLAFATEMMRVRRSWQTPSATP